MKNLLRTVIIVQVLVLAVGPKFATAQSSSGSSDDSGYDSTTWNHPPTTDLKATCHNIEGGVLVVDAASTGSMQLFCPAGLILQDNAGDVCSYTGTGVPCKMTMSAADYKIELSCQNPHTGSIDVNHTYYSCCDPAIKSPYTEVCTDDQRRGVATPAMAEQIHVMEAAVVAAQDAIAEASSSSSSSSWYSDSSNSSNSNSSTSNSSTSDSSSSAASDPASSSSSSSITAQCTAIKTLQDTYTAIPDKGLLDECGTAFQNKIVSLYNDNNCTFALTVVSTVATSSTSAGTSDSSSSNSDSTSSQ